MRRRLPGRPAPAQGTVRAGASCSSRRCSARGCGCGTGSSAAPGERRRARAAAGHAGHEVLAGRHEGPRVAAARARPLWDWELAYGPVVDELEPDLIHAHDFRMLGVGARAAIRARRAGPRRSSWSGTHTSSCPGSSPRADNARWMPAHDRLRAGVRAIRRRRHHGVGRAGRPARSGARAATDPAVVLNAPGARRRRPPADARRARPARPCAASARTRRWSSTAGRPHRSAAWTSWWRRCPSCPGCTSPVVVNAPQGPLPDVELTARAARAGRGRPGARAAVRAALAGGAVPGRPRTSG